MNARMNWNDAIAAIIAHTHREIDDYEVVDEARHTVYLEVSCILDNAGTTYDDESLCDWLANGDYDGTETPEAITDEWIAISAEFDY